MHLHSEGVWAITFSLKVSLTPDAGFWRTGGSVAASPYAEREEAKSAGAKWDWREKLWYIGPDGTRAGLAEWLPENAAASAPKASPLRARLLPEPAFSGP
jgi:hypothetical protein